MCDANKCQLHRGMAIVCVCVALMCVCMRPSGSAANFMLVAHVLMLCRCHKSYAGLGFSCGALFSTVQQCMIDLQLESSVQERFDILRGV